MQVYIVTSGEYSDYHICGVFLDETKAEYYAKFHAYDEGRVESYDTLDDNHVIDSMTMNYYDIVLSDKGEVISCELKTEEYLPGELQIREKFIHEGNAFRGVVITDSEEIAIKTMRDRKMKWLSETYGL